MPSKCLGTRSSFWSLLTSQSTTSSRWSTPSFVSLSDLCVSIFQRALLWRLCDFLDTRIVFIVLCVCGVLPCDDLCSGYRETLVMSYMSVISVALVFEGGGVRHPGEVGGLLHSVCGGPTPLALHLSRSHCTHPIVRRGGGGGGGGFLFASNTKNQQSIFGSFAFHL